MIAVDTNVLVRYVTNDDVVQGVQAMKILNDPQGVFISKTVILELEWVLRSVFRSSRESIQTAMLTIVGLPRITLENPEQIAIAIDYHRQGFDFADALHYASTSSQAAAGFHTFDSQFAKRGRKLGLDVHEIAVSNH